MKTCPQCNDSFEAAEKFCPRDGQVLNDAQQDLIGKVLDNQYEIEAFVASGGMGTVYRARHIVLGDRVAIKVLLPEYRTNPEWLRRFQREGQAARRFNHPNAVAVYDLRTSSEGLVYMVMEFVEGRPLDEELRRRGRYSPAEALEVLEPVGRVLEAAHRQGVVHRDLKPANVMVKQLEEGGVWIELLDLGIAKLSDFKNTDGNDNSPLTIAGQMLGTPNYMSPEQWGERQRDGNPEIDGRADIYSLGLMFYELVSGARPFDGKSLIELRLSHVAATPKRLDQIVADVPEEFARAVERAMQKDRGDRYANAAAFIEDLRAALNLPAARPAAAHATAALAASITPLKTQGDARLSISADTLTLLSADARDSTGPPASPNAPTLIATNLAAAPAPTSARASSQPSNIASPRAPKKSLAKLVVLAIVLLFVVCAGIAGTGWFLWSRWQQARMVLTGSPPDATAETDTKPADATTSGATIASDANGTSAASRVEALSYWIESFDSADQKEGVRVAQAGTFALASGQQFKFHFSPASRGFLYVVGPGERNAPTTFLTAEPTTGLLKTNLAAAGADFTFPYGAGQVLQLDKNPGTEEYTVIFSPTPLLEPKFLSARGGHALSPTEQKQLEDLRARAQTNAPALEDVKESGGERVVLVNVPKDTTAGPVVFDVRIEHH
ncbi:MAG: eukaryotic-like serine/threonine-protein kinase [Acidobacteriota bacterium]|nr:eukaryotic-like serine/threonine-protein kinase [Acidobacteriota bacterium]